MELLGLGLRLSIRPYLCHTDLSRSFPTARITQPKLVWEVRAKVYFVHLEVTFPERVNAITERHIPAAFNNVVPPEEESGDVKITRRMSILRWQKIRSCSISYTSDLQAQIRFVGVSW